MLLQSDTRTADEPATPADRLLALFADQVLSRPDQLAVRHGDEAVTFAELDAWSSALAAQLAERGARPGALVALAADRGLGAVAGVLAVIKTGAGYVGLDPSIPARRQRRMLEQTRPACVLAEPGLDQFPTLDAPRVRLSWTDANTDASDNNALPVNTPSDAADTEHIFHVVYTSGTTGQPKGVVIGYRAVLNRLEWMWQDHPFAEGSVLAIQKAVSLVASPWELLGGLLQGVPSVVLGRDEVLEPQLFAQAIDRERITHLYLTPHLIGGLLDGVQRLGGISHQPRLVTSGADALPVETVRRFRRAFPQTTLLNLYGMTEASSNVAAYDTAQLPDDADRVPVGKPVAHAEISVRDRLQRPLPPGVAGEVWVSGPPLALGYLTPQDDERFVTLHGGIVWLRTGDRGRVSSTGDLEIIGRSDNQIKIRGYRVELEEIEATLRKAPAVEDAGAFVTGDADPQIVAAVTITRSTITSSAPGGAVDIAALRAFLRDRLPDYMVPARIVELPGLPLNTGGKLDRAILADLVERAASGDHASFAAADETERAVAEIWQRLLGAAPAGREENFFDAGGHSLLAVRLANRLERTFNRRITLRQILAAPTLGNLIELCR